jgi:hypothetical protein
MLNRIGLVVVTRGTVADDGLDRVTSNAPRTLAAVVVDRPDSLFLAVVLFAFSVGGGARGGAGTARVHRLWSVIVRSVKISCAERSIGRSFATSGFFGWVYAKRTGRVARSCILTACSGFNGLAAVEKSGSLAASFFFSSASFTIALYFASQRICLR